MASPFEDPSVKAIADGPVMTAVDLAPSQQRQKQWTSLDDSISHEITKPSTPILKSPSLISAATYISNVAQDATASVVQSPMVQQVSSTLTNAHPMMQQVFSNATSASSSWLQSTKSAPPVPRDDDVVSAVSSDVSIPVGIIELKEIEQWAKRLRVAYMVISSIMAMAAFLSLGSNDLGVMFMALYVWFFALLIFCSELALKGVAKLIAQNFGFMYNPLGRLIFFLFVAVMCYELGLLGKIVMAMLTVASFVHLYVIIIHPAFEEYVRKKHYYNVQLSAAQTSSNV